MSDRETCDLCGHKKHRFPCFPNCPECVGKRDEGHEKVQEAAKTFGELRKEFREEPPSKRIKRANPSLFQAEGKVSCSCGCGVMVEIGPRYATPACRQRAKRKRDERK
jgi:hypothetical protein